MFMFEILRKNILQDRFCFLSQHTQIDFQTGLEVPGCGIVTQSTAGAVGTENVERVWVEARHRVVGVVVYQVGNCEKCIYR